MKIKNIKDPKVQQMAVVDTIKENIDCTLDHILEIDLLNAFGWSKSPQTNSFWDKIYYGIAPKYTDKDLWYKCIKGNVNGRFITNKLYQCQNDLFETAKAFIDETGVPSGFIINSNNFILATPEEVYNHLKQKDVEKQPTQEPICEDWEVYGVKLEEEVKDLKFKIANLEANKDWLSSQKEKLNKLVDEIEANCEDQTNPRMKLNAIHRLIHNYRNPSLVGTNQTVEIDGKKYEVTINKEI